MDDRKALSAAVGSVVWNAANHPNPTAVWGRDISPLREKVVDAVLASDWLAAHDREVEAKALEAAGQVMNADVSLFNAIEQCIATRGVGGANPIQDASVAWLEARAAALRSTPATDPEPTETNGEQR